MAGFSRGTGSGGNGCGCGLIARSMEFRPENWWELSLVVSAAAFLLLFFKKIVKSSTVARYKFVTSFSSPSVVGCFKVGVSATFVTWSLIFRCKFGWKRAVRLAEPPNLQFRRRHQLTEADGLFDCFAFYFPLLDVEWSCRCDKRRFNFDAPNWKKNALILKCYVIWTNCNFWLMSTLIVFQILYRQSFDSDSIWL